MVTAQTEYGRLKSVYLKKAGDAFVSNDRIATEWKSLHYLGIPDLNRSIEEYREFESFFQKRGVEIHYFPMDETVTMDSIYCRDAAIATDQGMVLCSMGKEGRVREPRAAQQSFEAAGMKILGSISHPGTLEGGDTAWLDERTLAVAHSYRSNEEGIRQLESLLRPAGIELVVVPLPHYRGSADVFHLMSVLSPVDRNLAVVYSPLLPIVFRKFLLDRGFGLVEVPDAEFESMGCNVLALAPGECLMVDGNPLTRAALEKAGCSVISYSGHDISIKGGGGPTCLTRPVWRIT
jgi:N-dimethylarginine dimethylaminohydrolase